ncbi:MAG: 16S rRNA (guanine(966)-N(2))-methyltransferase RsmD [Candidatus Wallbacteria bacterium]|nr:16S rRNA (guanine(966)-N(2))-methyltransferase RsmD [Candidatus Wallbacteria bacterium]
MRIVSGKYGSRHLVGPRAGGFRPTSDRVREALFNLLGPLGPEVAFADLYAGSGAVGIEALSRGAGRVVWVEGAGSSCWTIRKNLQELKIREGDVIQKKVAAWVAGPHELFDVVFADPPYELPVDQILGELAAGPLLKPEGLLVLEHTRRQESPDAVGRLSRVDRRKYGESMLSLYRETAEADPEQTEPSE